MPSYRARPIKRRPSAGWRAGSLLGPAMWHVKVTQRSFFEIRDPRRDPTWTRENVLAADPPKSLS